MKFFLSLAVYVLLAIVLVWGIALLVGKGNPWLLAAGFATYFALLVLLGFLPKKAH